jgi:quinolinate synthase
MNLTTPPPTPETPTQALNRLQAWKAKTHAVILAHNYQIPEVQDAADYTGDSLELSRIAAKTEAPVIVFAGVVFMAESAKILSPQKQVLLPVIEAGCPMADTVTAEDVCRARLEHPRAAVVTYVNSSAEVKAESDVCCTSANAVQVVNALSAEEIIFVPDKNLADWVARHTAKRIIPWAGSCCTHNNLKLADVEAALAEHAGAKFIAHPECRPEVCARADAVLSTSGMLKYVKNEPAAAFVIGTENGLLHRLRLENPGKQFFPVSPAMICRTMKMTTLSHVADALEFGRHAIEVPEPVRLRAARALDAMLQLV